MSQTQHLVEGGNGRDCNAATGGAYWLGFTDTIDECRTEVEKWSYNCKNTEYFSYETGWGFHRCTCCIDFDPQKVSQGEAN